MYKLWRKTHLSVQHSIKDGPQLILCATWPRRPAGYNNNIPILHIKVVPEPLCCVELECYCCTSWPARSSCAQNQLRTVLKWRIHLHNIMCTGVPKEDYPLLVGVWYNAVPIHVSSQNGLYPFWSILDWDFSCWNINRIILRKFVILLIITSKISTFI